MSVNVTENTFDELVLDRSYEVPVVVDFWADWCAPCKTLGPVLEKAEEARRGKVVLAKVDVEADQRLAALFRVQGIPAVKAFVDAKVVDEFSGAQPPARVEAFFDRLIPSRADELFAAGDELSLREAAELEPGRTDVALALARARLARGAEDEALEAVEGHDGDFAAAGIAARVRLLRAGVGEEAYAALDRGDRDGALDSLLRELSAEDGSEGELDPGERHDLLRRAIVGILGELEQGDPTARAYRRRLAAALG